MYSPALGRFLQTDPIGYKDDYNLYAYVGNDPTGKTDPTGEAAGIPHQSNINPQNDRKYMTSEQGRKDGWKPVDLPKPDPKGFDK